jgi:phage tail tape-measure protein
VDAWRGAWVGGVWEVDLSVLLGEISCGGSGRSRDGLLSGHRTVGRQQEGHKPPRAAGSRGGRTAPPSAEARSGDKRAAGHGHGHGQEQGARIGLGGLWNWERASPKTMEHGGLAVWLSDCQVGHDLPQ